MSVFRFGLSSDFKAENGKACYPDFDFVTLKKEPELSWDFVALGDEVQGTLVKKFDALVLLFTYFTGVSVARIRRLSLIAHFEVVYVTLNQLVCTENGIFPANNP